MTHEEHAKQIANSIKRETVAKYLKGAKEHGGNLWEVPLGTINEFAIEEVLDQGVYLKTMQLQVSLLKEWLAELFRSLENPIEEPLNDDDLALVRQIKELMGL